MNRQNEQDYFEKKVFCYEIAIIISYSYYSLYQNKSYFEKADQTNVKYTKITF